MSTEGIKNDHPPLLEGDDLSNLSAEQRQERIWVAKIAVLGWLRDRRRALIDANPASFKQRH